MNWYYFSVAYLIGAVLAYDMEKQIIEHQMGELAKDWTLGTKWALRIFAAFSWLTIIVIFMLRAILAWEYRKLHK